MRLPITNQTRQSADVQLSPGAWRVMLKAMPVISPLPFQPGVSPVRARIEESVRIAQTDRAIRIRVSTAELEFLERIARPIIVTGVH